MVARAVPKVLAALLSLSFRIAAVTLGSWKGFVRAMSLSVSGMQDSATARAMAATSDSPLTEGAAFLARQASRASYACSIRPDSLGSL